MPSRKPESFLPLRSHWFQILVSLVGGERHGYAIMQDVLARTDGKVRLWPATLYGSLKRLIEEVSEFGTVEFQPRLEGPYLLAIFAPKK